MAGVLRHAVLICSSTQEAHEGAERVVALTSHVASLEEQKGLAEETFRLQSLEQAKLN